MVGAKIRPLLSRASQPCDSRISVAPISRSAVAGISTSPLVPLPSVKPEAIFLLASASVDLEVHATAGLETGATNVALSLSSPLLYCQHVVIRIAVDQLVDGIDAGLGGKLVDRDREVALFLVDLLSPQ